MLDRALKPVLRQRLRQSPAVALVGPRQVGKTTLARSLKGAYFDLEQEEDCLKLDLQWEERTRAKGLTILDEAQAWPDVFPRLRGAIDEDRGRNGRFLLLGSVSPSLMSQVSESLAGRLSLLELSPLSFSELETSAQRKRLWLCGGYPDGGVLRPSRYPRWQRDYLTTLTQRDLPTWGLPTKPRTTDRLLRMLAASHGQTWNASQIGRSLGLSYQSINTYVEYLEGAFLIRRLPPFFTNLRKRLVKSPKVYWRDSGLLHSLLNVEDDSHLLEQPWVGASWEGFAIEQILAALQNRDVVFDAYFLRTSDGHEIDLLLELGRSRWAVEIKLTTAPGPQDMSRLKKVASWVEADRCLLVSRVSEPVVDEHRISCGLQWLLENLDDLLSR